tara:strand:- start:1195 stop:2010 length:816 start_codon:yes stop_codon:yes gene_type:complete
MNNALCISGHARAFERTINNQKKCLIEINNCDIFVYTSNLVSQRKQATTRLTPEYSHIGEIYERREKSGKINGIMYNVDPIELEQRIRKIYGERLKEIKIENESIEENLSLGYQTSNLHAANRVGKPFGWVKKTFEKTYKCHKLFKQYCKKNQKVYDSIIRSRTDLEFKHSIKIQSTGEQYGNKIIAFGGWDPRGAHSENGYKNYFFDGFAVSNVKNMDTYCNFYTDAKENFAWANGLEPQLHAYLESTGLKYVSIGDTTHKSQKAYKIVR